MILVVLEVIFEPYFLILYAMEVIRPFHLNKEIWITGRSWAMKVDVSYGID